MNAWALSVGLPLADFFVFATLLLLAALAAMRRITQPARRLALAWSTVLTLAGLAVFCVLPDWPRFSLAPSASAAVDVTTGAGVAPVTDNGVQGDVSFDKQDDGRWRSSQLLPDEEFTLTLDAEGYRPKSEKLTLAEGAVKEIEWKLVKE